MSGEQKLHRYLEKCRGNWDLKTEWGNINIKFNPIRKGWGSQRGRPDEILLISLKFVLAGERFNFKIPFLIEDEKVAGIHGAMEDLKLYALRSLDGTDTSYLELPMLVIGNKRSVKKTEIEVKAKIKIIETSFSPK